MFSLCLGNGTNNGVNGTDGAGFMVLGDSGANNQAGFLGFTPIQADWHKYYSVDLQSVAFDVGKYAWSKNLCGLAKLVRGASLDGILSCVFAMQEMVKYLLQWR